MKIKMLLPVLALIFATGMSFTTVSASQNTISGFVERTPGNWQAVNVDCQGNQECLVQFAGEPQTHQVYATMDKSQPLNGSGEVIILNP